MSEELLKYPLGTLVNIRGREWVVEPCDIKDCVKLRPLGGTDDETQIVMPEIENSELKSAVFPAPTADQIGRFDSAKLLRDSLKLKLTNAAGPFRSFGHLAFEPRSYQLVPLLMALKMPVVRLLIADDVGIGKTIEAGLIVKELYERGEISKFVVLCPPHLVSQWVCELKEHFNIDAVGVTAKSIAGLEKEVSGTEEFFSHYPASVISLDYIKTDNHREWFKTHIGDDTMLVVDEAHTCCVGGGRQLRFNLLQELANKPERDIILLTATPHSGDEQAFNNLLSLLKPDFARLDDLSVDHSDAEKRKLREDLGHHLVQRRRIDVINYPGKASFPERKVKEVTYKLSGEWGEFFKEVREYCVDIASKAEAEKGFKGRMMWYATLALLRCISSSPAAAKCALSTRLNMLSGNLSEDDRAQLEDFKTNIEENIQDTCDGSDDSEINDQLVNPILEDSATVRMLIEKAELLSGRSDDPKLRCIVKHIKDCYKEVAATGDTYRPVIFCKYIATAHYLADSLKDVFPKHTIACVTGELTNEERSEKVAELAESENPILVATDCLSEGINLQDTFNAIVHYDLAWNPTRHEQREGRVDRFGQQSKKVWCTMFYGEDNPVDGLIFNVILRKAEKIKEDLGISVPVPENNGNIRVALVKAALLKGFMANAKSDQLEMDFGEEYAEIKVANQKWASAIEKEKRNRTIFSQQSLKPDEIMPEWDKTKEALGDSEDVQNFFEVATTRLNIAREKVSEHGYTLDVKSLPREIKSQLPQKVQELTKKLFKISFTYPPAQGFTFIHRTNPVVESIANYLLEGALTGANPIASRAGAYVTDAVNVTTGIFLLRVRYQLKNTGKNTRKLMMAEESIAVAVNLEGVPNIMEGESVEALLQGTPAGNMDETVIRQSVQKALDFYAENGEIFKELASRRALSLSDDHTRVRAASAQRTGSTTVEACLPADLIGVYVLLPEEL
ncbi:MAG: DEAD/DEAH box helicase [Fibrobacter sp.]|nr:DEAD/DEAH box helicase [Fibrobacter sp.]